MAFVSLYNQFVAWYFEETIYFCLHSSGNFGRKIDLGKRFPSRFFLSFIPNGILTFHWIFSTFQFFSLFILKDNTTNCIVKRKRVAVK